MKQSKAVWSSKPGVAGKTPGKKKISLKQNQEIHQNNGHHFDGLDKYFQILPLVESFLNETNPQLKKSNGIFFTPYPAHVLPVPYSSCSGIGNIRNQAASVFPMEAQGLLNRSARLHPI